MTPQPLPENAPVVSNGRLAQAADSAEPYRLHCPDVVEITVDGKPRLCGKRLIEPDGRIELAAGERVRIDGQTVPDSIRLVAARANLQPCQIDIKVAAFKSQWIYVFGPGIGVQRAVSYKGPETVLQFLRRTGAVTPCAAPNNIYVVRPRIIEGGPPEVFPVRLRASMRHKEQQTDLPLQPFDQVYIGETRRSCVARCVAPCLRPLYDALCGFHDPANKPGPAAPDVPARPPVGRADGPLPAPVGGEGW
jgi:protein involved in polysaccharide export with SLBB domain